MSSEPVPEVIGELDPVELRVIGCLVEKQAVTPDVYPMTTNALVSAANQKTSREPVTDYNAATIDSALLRLRERGLVRMVHQQGSRATKHRHVLDEALGLAEADRALLAVLMLRGAQTPGELRSRTERIWTFDDVADVEAALRDLATRGYVVEHDRVPGQSARRWSHLLGLDEGSQPSGQTAPGSQPSVQTPPGSQPSVQTVSGAQPSGQTAPETQPSVQTVSGSQPSGQTAPGTQPSVETAPGAQPSGQTAPGSQPAPVEEIAALRHDLATLTRRFDELCARLGETEI